MNLLERDTDMEILIEIVKQIGAVAVVVIPAVITLLASHSKSHKSIEDKVDTLGDCLETLYVERIECLYNKYSAKGYCPAAAKIALENLYEECKKRGWNGEVTFMRDELRRLPAKSTGISSE